MNSDKQTEAVWSHYFQAKEGHRRGFMATADTHTNEFNKTHDGRWM